MINYDLKKIKALMFDVDGVLSCGAISLGNDGEPKRTVNIKDGYALQLAVKRGMEMAIITGAKTEAIGLRYYRLGIREVWLNCSVKKDIYKNLLDKLNLKAEEVMFMGDDIPDYEVMCVCGLPCCPADAAIEIKEISTYISPYKGGEGCVRDVVEQILRAQKKWVMDHTAFGW